MAERRCSLCDLEVRRLRPAFWARDLFYCSTCWQLVIATNAVPWFTPLEEADCG